MIYINGCFEDFVAQCKRSKKLKSLCVSFTRNVFKSQRREDLDGGMGWSDFFRMGPIIPKGCDYVCVGLIKPDCLLSAEALELDSNGRPTLGP